MAFELKHEKHDILLRFVTTKIIRDAMPKLIRDLTHTWALVKGVLDENYHVTYTIQIKSVCVQP